MSYSTEICLAGRGQSCLIFGCSTLASRGLVCNWLRTWLCHTSSERPQQFFRCREVLNESLSSDLLRILPLSLHQSAIPPALSFLVFPRCAPPQDLTAVQVQRRKERVISASATQDFRKSLKRHLHILASDRKIPQVICITFASCKSALRTHTLLRHVLFAEMRARYSHVYDDLCILSARTMLCRKVTASHTRHSCIARNSSSQHVPRLRGNH